MNANPLTTQIDLGGFWMACFFVFIAVTVARVICKFARFVPAPAKLLWIYVLAHALFILEYPALFFGPVTTAFKMTAGHVFVEAFFVPVGVWLFRDWVKTLIPWAVAYTLLAVWLPLPPILNAESFNLAFVACALPLLPRWLVVAGLVTIFSHHANTALVIVAAQALVYIVRYWPSLALAYPAMLLAMLAVAWMHPGFLVGAADRLHKYELFMSFWAKSWHWVAIGVGPGTFIWTSYMMDSANTTDLFMQMHSDWLQILFELGVVGFALAAATWVMALKKAWADTKLVSALFGCAAFALTYHPLRYCPSAILVAYVFLCAFSYRRG